MLIFSISSGHSGAIPVGWELEETLVELKIRMFHPALPFGGHPYIGDGDDSYHWWGGLLGARAYAIADPNNM